VTRAFLRGLTVAFAGSCLLPIVTTIGALLETVLAAVLLFRRSLERLDPILDEDSRAQVLRVELLPERWLNLAIGGAAALSLFLELAMIRWQASVFPFFAFYTNFGLLACFAGLGLGYALSARDRIPLILVLPTLAWQVIVLLVLKSMLGHWELEYLGAMPVVEQLSMGLKTVRSLGQGVAIYFFLSVVFLLTALAFIPIGQLCGRLMTRRQPRRRRWHLCRQRALDATNRLVQRRAAWGPAVRSASSADADDRCRGRVRDARGTGVADQPARSSRLLALPDAGVRVR
jgi:hypothetical protein